MKEKVIVIAIVIIAVIAQQYSLTKLEDENRQLFSDITMLEHLINFERNESIRAKEELLRQNELLEVRAAEVSEKLGESEKQIHKLHNSITALKLDAAKELAANPGCETELRLIDGHLRVFLEGGQ